MPKLGILVCKKYNAEGQAYMYMFHVSFWIYAKIRNFIRIEINVFNI